MLFALRRLGIRVVRVPSAGVDTAGIDEYRYTPLAPGLGMSGEYGKKQIRELLRKLLGRNVVVTSTSIYIPDQGDEPAIISRPYLAPLGQKSARVTRLRAAAEKVTAPRVGIKSK